MRSTKPADSAWNSLEIAKLVVALATPLVVAITGWILQDELVRQETTQKMQMQLADHRLAVYDEVKTSLDRIYCFVEDVGTWKTETPDAIIALKRQVDQEMFSNQAIWSPRAFSAYKVYMDAAFLTYGGEIGDDAKIRTTDTEKRIGVKGWLEQWSNRLAPPDPEHRAKYLAMNDAISRDLMLE